MQCRGGEHEPRVTAGAGFRRPGGHPCRGVRSPAPFPLPRPCLSGPAGRGRGSRDDRRRPRQPSDHGDDRPSWSALLRRNPGCLAEDDVHLAQALADSAALALMHWSAEPEHLDEVITRVQGVIASKAVLEIAKGMVPQYAGATIEEASRLLSSCTSVALTRQHASAIAEPSTGAAEPVSELLSGRHPVPSASARTPPLRTSSAPCRNTGAGGSPSSTAGTWSASSPKPMSPVPLPARRWANRSRPAPPIEGSHGERHESASAFRACGGTASWSSGRPSSCSASCWARRDSRSATVSPASAGWRRMVPSSMR